MPPARCLVRTCTRTVALEHNQHVRLYMLSSLAVYLCIAASHYSGDYLIGFANTVDCARAMAPGAPGPARAGRISRADPTGGVFRPIRTVAIPRLFSI